MPSTIPGALPLLPFNAPTTSAPPPMFRMLAIATSGLSAQRVRMEVAANNIANAETTHGPGGQPYQREVVSLQPGTATPQATIPQLLPLAQNGPDFASAARDALAATAATANPADTGAGTSVAAIATDPTPGPLVYDPGHPDANAQGYVRYPNVEITTEMVDMMDARRVYEANATTFEAGKAMLRRAIDI